MKNDAKNRGGRSGWRIVIWWIPTLVWAGTIYAMSSRSIHQLPSWWFPHADKIIHAGLFGLLAFLVFLALRRGHGAGRRASAMLAVLATLVYGAADEFHQRFVPHRSSDLADLAADVGGATAAAILAAALDAAVGRRFGVARGET